MISADLSQYILGVYIAVSLSKYLLDLVNPPSLSAWLTRLLAIVWGIAIVIINNRYGTETRITGYAAMVTGIQAAISSMLLYHIGNGDFIGYFDGRSNGSPKPAARKLQTPESVAAMLGTTVQHVVPGRNLPLPEAKGVIVNVRPTGGTDG